MPENELDEEMRKLLKYSWRYKSEIHVHKSHPTYCHVANQPGMEHYYQVDKVDSLKELGLVESIEENGSGKSWRLTEEGLAMGQMLFEEDPNQGPTLKF